MYQLSYLIFVFSLSVALVESIPQHFIYKANLTFGIPLEKVWNDLISTATDQVDVASFYWTLTGEDINVNSSSDIPVSYQWKQAKDGNVANFKESYCANVKKASYHARSVLGREGTS